MGSRARRVRAGFAVMVVAMGSVLVAHAAGPHARPALVIRTRAVVTDTLEAAPPSLVTTPPAPVPVPVVTTLVPSTTAVAPPVKVVVSIPSGPRPNPVVVPTNVRVPPTLLPAITPTLPTTTVPNATGHITVTLQIDPPSPKVGETVHFILLATGGAWCCIPHIDFGDGSSWWPYGSNNTPCPLTGTPSWRSDVTHVFAAPGHFAVVGNADGFTTCMAPPDFAWLYGHSGTNWITVGP